MISFNEFVEVLDETALSKFAEKWPAPYALTLGEMLGETEGFYPIGIRDGNWIVHPGFAKWMQSRVADYTGSITGPLRHHNTVHYKHSAINTLIKDMDDQAAKLIASYTPDLVLPEDTAFQMHQALMYVLTEYALINAFSDDSKLPTIALYPVSQGLSFLMFLFRSIEDLRPKGFERLWKKDSIPSTPRSVGVVKNINATMNTLHVFAGKWNAPSLSPNAIHGFYDALAGAVQGDEAAWEAFSDFGWSMSGIPPEKATISRVPDAILKFLNKLCSVLDLEVKEADLTQKTEFEESEEEFSLSVATMYYDQAYSLMLPLTRGSPYLVFILYGLAVQHILLTYIVNTLFHYNLLLSASEEVEAEALLEDLNALISILESEIDKLVEDATYWEVLKEIRG